MPHLVNKDFIILIADGSNYMAWAMDVKIMLLANDFINAINEPNPEAPVSEAAKLTTLHFLRCYLHSNLKKEYAME